MHVLQKEEEEAEVTTEVQEMVEEEVQAKEQEERGNLVGDGKYLIKIYLKSVGRGVLSPTQTYINIKFNKTKFISIKIFIEQ